MFGKKPPPKPELDPAPLVWYVDYQAALTALIVGGTITADEADAISHDAVFLQGNPMTTPRVLASELSAALDRVRAEAVS